MSHLFSLSTFILDMLILTTFLSAVFRKKEPFRVILYLAMLTALTLLILLTVHIIRVYNLPWRIPALFLARALAVLSLTSFFTASLRSRISASLGFPLLAEAGRLLFRVIVLLVNPDFLTLQTLDHPDILYGTTDGGARLILLIFSILLSFYRRRREAASSGRNLILLLSTPVMSLLIYSLLPLNTVYRGSTLFYHALFACLAVLNAANYFLLRRSWAYAELEMKTAKAEQQLQFQQEKYKELGDSYRKSRRLIHDVRKHYITIEEYVSHGDMTGLLAYTKTAVRDLETSYARYNTGNLVIDSFLSHYAGRFESDRIAFTARLGATCDRIPLNDYELSIVLGNLLDNAYEACSASGASDKAFFIEITISENNQFRIHTENTSPNRPLPARESTSYDHGYGLDNIRRIVEANRGFLAVHSDELFVVDILIPIPDPA